MQDNKTLRFSTARYSAWGNFYFDAEFEDQIALLNFT